MQDINGYERFIGLLPGCYSMGVSHPETFVAGANLVLNSAEAPLTALTVYGHSTQDGTPSPDNPVPIVSAGDSGEIEAKVYGGNLISSDISSWNRTGWHGTVLQLSDGIKIKAINGWEKACYDTSEMNGKTLNLSFDYRQIESETTSPITGKAFAVVVQDENKYPLENIDIFLFQIDSPETVKTHVSVSFIARNYLGLYLRVNTEGEEAGETRAIEVTNIMLNAGNTALAFEPYVTPQTLTLSTPGGLPGIPVSSGGNYTDGNGQQWICDEVDFERGVYVRRVKCVRLSGDIYDTEISLGRYIINVSNIFGSIPNVRYPVTTSVASTIEPITQSIQNQIFQYGDGIYWYCTDYFSSKEELQTFLEENDVTIIGHLATPIETDLPAEEITAYQALHTYTPNTTVSNDADAWMKVGYYGLSAIQKLEKEALLINGGKSK